MRFEQPVGPDGSRNDPEHDLRFAEAVVLCGCRQCTQYLPQSRAMEKAESGPVPCMMGPLAVTYRTNVRSCVLQRAVAVVRLRAYQVRTSIVMSNWKFQKKNEK